MKKVVAKLAQICSFFFQHLLRHAWRHVCESGNSYCQFSCTVFWGGAASFLLQDFASLCNIVVEFVLRVRAALGQQNKC